MTSWVATASAALDIARLADRGSEAQLMVCSIYPSEPIGLAGEPAALWRKLVDRAVPDSMLTPTERQLLLEYAEAGIATTDLDHPSRVQQLDVPWFVSPLHEMVYGLVSEVARQKNIRVVFIKGPVLHRQTLRDRMHSGDVDVWVEPGGLDAIVSGLAPWGWAISPGMWGDSPAYHSVTLVPTEWGCEIDVHRHMPGCDLPDDVAFEILWSASCPMRIGSKEVSTPSVPAHSVIAALHLMRSQYGREPSDDNRTGAIRALRSAGLDALEFAENIRASAALESVLRSAFPQASIRIEYRPPLNWRWRTERNPLKRYVLALRMIRLRSWPTVIRSILWPNDTSAMLADRLNSGTARSARTARLRRLWRGVQRTLRNRVP